jgi:hypothetical protein
MRKCHETRNYSILLSLIEEAQSMGNRMEAKLGSISNYKEMDEDLKKRRNELRELKKEIEELKEKK